MKQQTQNKQLPEGWKEVEQGNKEYFEILPSGINKIEGVRRWMKE